MNPLLDLYASTDRATRIRGRKWYPKTRRQLQALADEYNRPLSQVVAVFAITSVAAQLAANLRWTEECLQGIRQGGRYPNVQGPRVAGALSTRYPSRFCRGPKVSAFYRAIMGDPHVVVLDRWALRAAGWEGEGQSVPNSVRVQFERAYQDAAAEAREGVRNFQAIVWLALRESTPKSNGVLPNLWDVTHERGDS